jgi:TetR/AcrR family transcriptional regulator, ethionamide resistance regulator
VTTASPTRAPRGRRGGRPSGDDRELAILDTAIRLLDARQEHEISVDDLAKGAGISRPTFYFYFPSKDAVLMTLLERVISEVDAAWDRLVVNPPQSRNEFWRAGIALFFESFGAHKEMSRAGYAVRARVPEAYDMWATAMRRWIDRTAGSIETARSRGTAPVTLPAIEIATALNLMNERVMVASFADDRPSVPADHVVDTLVHVWIASIYGDTT